MRRVFFLLLLPVASLLSLQAQYVFSGSVKTSKNEILPGAIVSIDDLNRHTVTNANGTFTISNVPAGQYKITVRFIGYNTLSDEIVFTANVEKDYVLDESVTTFDEVVVAATRANTTTPTTFTIVQKKELKKLALGQDAPYLLALSPSVVSTSDAGNGIGYTSLRIRGSEASKTNVTINGVPLNDPESHGVYWVDVPDIAASSQSIQIQRGVGTSSNGAGAFGATINLQTDNVSQVPFYEYNGSFGSFNTMKNSVAFSTGLINTHWFLEGKVTGIKSDGYIDRAWSDLKSYFAQAGYYSENTLIKLVSFGGREETYQAWYGIDEATLNDPNYGRTFNWTGAYTDKDGNTRFYDKMIDHYEQDHVQLHAVHSFNKNLNLNVALHYTYGRGYYQDFVPKEWEMPLEYFKLPTVVLENNDTVKYTDLIHRLWLDNHFYGTIWGLNYKTDKLSLIWGGGANRYAPAKHYGQVMWARYYLDGVPGDHYYDNEGNKNDVNSYIKIGYNIIPELTAFADFQYRYIRYKAWGTNREYVDDTVNINKTYHFNNPKFGLLYKLNENISLYSSYAIAHREPTRSDFVDAAEGEEPRPERLNDLEVGIRYNSQMISAELVGYDMQYRDQLVLTGRVNSVGTPIRENVGKSYRRGIEVIVSIQPIEKLKLEGNATFSTNKTDYNEIVNNVLIQKKNDIAYSPNFIAGGKMSFIPIKGFETTLLMKHVGKQYFDNTQSKDKMLDAYTIFDWLNTYAWKWEKVGEFQVSFKINNVFDKLYISNARVSSSGTKYYYPQAGRNYLIGLNIKF